MATVARAPLADISNHPRLAHKQAPKRNIPFQDKENIDPLTLEGFLLFGLSACPHCRALVPAETAHDGCKKITTYIDYPVAAQLQSTRTSPCVKKPNLRAL